VLWKDIPTHENISGLQKVRGLTAARAAAAVSAAVALAALRQANGVRAALQGAAGGLANTADDIRGALQGLAEEADNTGHFYWRRGFYERGAASPTINRLPTQISVPSVLRASTPEVPYTSVTVTVMWP
jgi:hypothetical protein